MVLGILGDLEEKMQLVEEKVDQIQTEEKKHYDSLRRGLKRLKEDKPISPSFEKFAEPRIIDLVGGPEDRHMMQGLNYRGDNPCCICNYCLKRMDLEISLLIVSGCCYICYVRHLR